MTEPTLLETIVAAKRKELLTMAEPDPRRLRPSQRNFGRALKSGRTRVAIIAEVKKASPSAGLLCADFDPVAIARDYEAEGAAAVSVLTDGPFFQGSLDHLTAVSRAVTPPVLRKDFIVDDRQILEARAAGADSVLLIAAILDEPTLHRFLGLARSLQMEPLVEIHDAAELEKAVNAGALVVGINNRDLRSFRIDLELTHRLAPQVPRQVTVVCESGIESAAEIARLVGVVDAALIGTSLMKSADRRGLLKSFVEAAG